MGKTAAAGARADVPAEQVVPELLEDLMLMGTVEYSGQVIQQSRHVDTRRYLTWMVRGRRGRWWPPLVWPPSELRCHARARRVHSCIT